MAATLIPFLVAIVDQGFIEDFKSFIVCYSLICTPDGT